MSARDPSWLTVARGDAPLVVSIPHAGADLASTNAHGWPSVGWGGASAPRVESAWLARKDCDWHVDRLYGFASDLGATVVRTAISRTVIDVNRDPSGATLYPGMATTELCPTTTFDGEPLYGVGDGPDEVEIAVRRRSFFDPYHAALRREIDRLRAAHPRVVLYDCHSIRSVVPRLFDGTLPDFNVGTNDGRSCDAWLTKHVERAIDDATLCGTGFQPVASDTSGHGLQTRATDGDVPLRVTNGRFKGGHITRHHGDPAAGVHAIQMELAMRGYLREPPGPVNEGNWPPPYDADFAAPMIAALRRVLAACLDFAREGR